MIRRSRIRLPTWSSIVAVDRPLFGLAIVPHPYPLARNENALVAASISINAIGIVSFPQFRHNTPRRLQNQHAPLLLRRLSTPACPSDGDRNSHGSRVEEFRTAKL